MRPALVELLSGVGDSDGRDGAIVKSFDGLDGHWEIDVRGGSAPRLALSRIVELDVETQTSTVSELVATIVEGVATRGGGEDHPGARFAGYLREALFRFRPVAGRHTIVVALSRANVGRVTGATEVGLPGFPWEAALFTMASAGQGLGAIEKIGTLFGVLGLQRDDDENFELAGLRILFADAWPPRFELVMALP